METLVRGFYTGERALFHISDKRIEEAIFDDGESPLKHSSNIELYNTSFKWKYPIWYSNNIRLKDCRLFEMARAGMWYTNDLTMENVMIEAPKLSDVVTMLRLRMSTSIMPPRPSGHVRVSRSATLPQEATILP